MTPLKIFDKIVICLGQKPFDFWPDSDRANFVKDLKSAIFKLKTSLESKNLQDTHVYKIILALEKDVLEKTINEVSFIQHLFNLVEVYRFAPSDEELLELIHKLESDINAAKTKLLEYHIALENLKKVAKKITEDEQEKKDLETLQKVGVFYVLEYTLQVLWEFQHLKDEDKVRLLEKGLKTKVGSLQAYLPLEETFKKELCYKIFDEDLRNKLLAAFYSWEEVLYNQPRDYKRLFFALKQFNLELLQAFDGKGYKIFKAAIYAPWGNNMPISELIKNLK